MKKNTPTICILDNDQDRCVREEAALDQAIADKNINAHGISNYGACFIARSGMEKNLPAICISGIADPANPEIDELYFTKKAGEELTYDLLCNFLDIMIKKGFVSVHGA